MHKAKTLSLQWQQFCSFRGSRHSPSPHPGDHHPQAQGEPRPLHGRHLSWGRKHNVAPYFCVQKDFAPSSSNCRRCCPGRLLTCKKVGNAPYSSVPRSTWVTSPRHPGGREASEAAQEPASSPAETAAPAPRPSPPRRPQTCPGKGRGGELGAAAPVPRSPPTSRSRARRALPGLPLPSPREGRARAPGSTVERRPRPLEPQAAGEAGTLGLSGGQRLPPEPARTPGA